LLWINVVKEKATIKKQWFRNNLSLLCKKCKILVKNGRKKNERNTKEVSWSDLLKNQKHVNDATLFNHVILQTQKQRHCTACSEFESLNSFEKVTEMSKENCKLSAYNALKLCDINIWCTRYIEYK